MKYYKLTNFVYKYFFLQNILLCLALFFVTHIMLSAFALSNTDNALHAFLPYESIIYLSNLPYVFVGSLCLQAILSSLRCMGDFSRMGGVNIFLMLPGSRRAMVLAFISAGVLGALMLFATQTISLLTAYPSVVSACQSAANTSSQQLGFPVARSNGLFLAVLRSDLFHILLPQSLPETLHSLLLLLCFGSAPALTLFGSDKSLNGA